MPLDRLIKFSGGHSFQRYAPYGSLALILVLVAGIPGPIIMSEWESFTIYGTFGTPFYELNFQPSPRANISFQGYAPLEVSRYVLNFTGASPSLALVRLPALLIGLITLLLVFVTANRWFGAWPALAGTAFIGFNPIFSQYQHELIVTGPSLMAFCLFFERLQYVSQHRHSVFAWSSLAFSLSFVMLLYGPGRIASVAVLAIWIFAVLMTIGTSRDRLIFIFTSLLTVSLSIVTLWVLSFQNSRLGGLNLLFPPQAESLLTNSASAKGLSRALKTNAQILIESFVLGGGQYHSGFLEATMIQGRFPMIPLVLVPFVVVGGLFAIRQWIRLGPLLPSRWNAPIFLLGITTGPLLLSSFFVEMDAENDTSFLLGTLVNYRMVFALLPCALLVSIATWWLMTSRPTLKYTGLTLLLVALTYSLVSVPLSRQAFANLVSSYDTSSSGRGAQSHWLKEYSLKDRSRAWASHFTQHAQYKSWAVSAVEHIPTKADLSPCTPVLYAPIDAFSEAPLYPHSLGPFIPGRNFHSPFLAVYLASERSGLNPGFIFVPKQGVPLEPVGDKLSLWSATLEQLSDGTYEYADADFGHATLLTLNGAEANVIVVTTQNELDFLEKNSSCISLLHQSD